MREQPTATNLAAKGQLARLMATENIRVEHDPSAKTASFNMRDRVLTLPVWKDLAADTLDMLIGHEVSHALYTPPGEQPLLDACKKIDAKRLELAKAYLNVVEDARIERLIKRDFPGLRRNFVTGYDDLMKRDLFGLSKIDDLATLPLIDRINLQYKIGHRVSIPFNAAELPLVQRVATTLSWDEVVALSKAIYDLAKEQKKKEQEQKAQKEKDSESATVPDQDQDDQDAADDTDGEGDQDSEGESNADDTGDEDGDSNGEAEANDDENEADAPEGEQGEGDVDAKSNGKDAEGGDEETDSGSGSDTSDEDDGSTDTDGDDVAPDDSQTAKNAESALASRTDQNAQAIWYADIAAPTDTFTVKLTDVVAGFRRHFGRDPEIGKRLSVTYNAWKTANATAVQTLATEFDRRKAADEHRRSTVAETGVIDVNRLHAYKITDDIFLRNAIVRDGKNHGLVLLLDMSGSIHQVFHDLVTQLVTLAHFCRRVNIPFRFYGFTDRAGRHAGYDHLNLDSHVVKNDYTPANYFKSGSMGADRIPTRLLTLLTDGMKTQDFMEQCSYLLYASWCITYAGTPNWDKTVVGKALREALLSTNNSYNGVPFWFTLEQTPLNAALLGAISLVPAFKREKGLQVANLIVLTDGEASDGLGQHTRQTDGYREKAARAGATQWSSDGKVRIVYRDPVTRKEYKGSRRSSYAGSTNEYSLSKDQETELMLAIAKDRGIKTVCIHVTVTKKVANQVARRLVAFSGKTTVEIEADHEKLVKDLRENDWTHVENVEGFDDYIVFPVPAAVTEETLDVVGDTSTAAGLRSLRNQFFKVAAARKGNRPLLVRVADLVSK